MALGALAAWFLTEATGPHLVGRYLDAGLGRREGQDWQRQVVDHLVEGVRVGRLQRGQLRRWLEAENVVQALVDGDKDAVEASLDELISRWSLSEDEAVDIRDGLIGTFPQSLEPATAVAVAEYRRSLDHQGLERQLERIEGALAAASRPRVRSVYHRTVERVAPSRLIGRGDELAELAGFCLRPELGPYVWWRAEAWAGKSALMSTFALDPPPGVDVVSLFITARDGRQNDRAVPVRGSTTAAVERAGTDPMALHPPRRRRHTDENTRSFAVILTHRTGDRDLKPWIAAVTDDGGHPELKSFARCLLADYDAVRAGLTLAYFSGPVEGHNNRKMIKGKLYRRAKLDLLRNS